MGPESEALEKAVAGLFSDSGRILTRMVLIAESMPQSGDRVLSVDVSNGMTQWDASGMLRCAQARTDAMMATDWSESLPDGDEGG